MEFFIDFNLPEKVKDDVFPMQQFMEYNEDTYDVLGSVFLKEMQTLDDAGEFKVQEHACRFDNIAYKMMNSPDYWWYVMEYNNKIDWNVKEDEILKIPDIAETTFLKNNIVIRQNKKNLNV